MSVAIEPDIEAEARRLLEEVWARGLSARLIGGMAVRLLAGEQLQPAYRREIRDLDFVLLRRDGRAMEALLADAGYAPEQQFNALNGHRRLLFLDEEHGRQIDVFVEAFEMCHRLPLAERLDERADTLAPADVLMTKLQIVHLNPKDRGDLYALLLSHEIGADGIDAGRITELTANDWGLQRTFELNLERLREGLDEQPLDADARRVVAERIDALAAAMEAAPKSRRWKLRAKVGERKRWYEEPEEVDRED